MAFTPFRNLHRVTNNTGRIDESQTPASEIIFAYQYQIDLTDRLEFSTGSIVIVTIGADFLLSAPDGTPILEWSFSVRYECAQDIFGFTYFPSAQSTTVIQPTPPPAIIGDPSGIVIAGQGDQAAGADIIFDTFESAIYVVNVPPGSTVKIVHHTAGYPALDDILGLQVRTKLGGSAGWASGVRHGLDGEAFVLFSGAGGASQARAVGRTRTLTAPVPLGWGEDTPLYLTREQAGHRAVVIYGSKGTVYGRVSVDGGRTWALETLWAGYTPVGTAAVDGGTVALLTNASGAAFVAVRFRLGTVSDPALCTLPAGVKLSAGTLMVTPDGGLDFAWPGASGLTILHSSDGGKNWT